MKKVFNGVIMIVTAIAIIFLGSCNNDDATVTPNVSTFDYNLSSLTGIWETDMVQEGSTGEWFAVDGSVSGYSIFNFKIRFNDDYTYLLDGVTSNESGIYTTSGSIIETYVNGVMQAEYDIKSLENGSMTMMVIRGTDATTYSLSKIW